MRILVTGASGLLGLNLCLQSYDSHEIIGVDRQWLDGLPFTLEKIDLLESGSVDRLLDGWKPEAVIHCAALADLEACEADPGFAARVNAELPGELATSCSALNIALVYISTDAVFDGKKDGTYTEKDRPNPLSVYAKTKLEGEYAVLSKHKNALAVRVNFFGWSLSGKRSLSEFFYNKLSTGKKCSGFTDIWFCPMFVGDLVEILFCMLDKKLSGLYNVVGSESLTKYEFGVCLAQQFGFNEDLINPQSIAASDLTSKRSPNMRLSVDKLSTDLGMDIPGVSTGLEKFYTQYTQGYPQKIRSYPQR